MVKKLFINAKWEKEIKLNETHLKEIKKYTSITLFSSSNFSDKIDDIITKLKKEGIEIKTSKADRTCKNCQILGCDIYQESFKPEIKSSAVLYIGDGDFHPTALLYSQMYSKIKFDLLVLNPYTSKIEKYDTIKIKKNILKMKANLLQYLNSKNVGILVTTKPGQNYLELAKQLKKQLELKSKKAYIFLDNEINLDRLEDFIFIDCWINTGCPRIGTDDILNFNKPLINIKEAFKPEDYLGKINV